jgi:hypothetical protein
MCGYECGLCLRGMGVSVTMWCILVCECGCQCGLLLSFKLTPTPTPSPSPPSFSVDCVEISGDSINFSAYNIEENEEVNTRIVSRNRRKIPRQKYTQHQTKYTDISITLYCLRMYVENWLEF